MQAHKRSFLAKNCILPFLIKSFPLLLPSHNIASIIKQCSVFKVHRVLFSALRMLTCVSLAPLRFRLLNLFFKKLNETSKFLSLLQSVSLKWWAKMDSNHRPHDYQSCALASWAIGPYPKLLWWRVPGSNRWPPACKAGALPAELTPHKGSLFLRFSAHCTL